MVTGCLIPPLNPAIITPMTATQSIKVKTMCLFVHNGKVLIQSGASLKKRVVDKPRPIIEGDFYRVLGGSLNLFETAEEGIRREIKEELGSEIENLQFLQVVENIFTYWGEKNHEIVFLYRADLTDKSLYEREKIHIVEDVYEFDAEWMPIEKILNKEITLYPLADYGKFLK